MKIRLKLQSELFSDEEKDFWYYQQNFIEIDWDIPMFPRVKEDFDLQSIVSEEIPNCDPCLTWTVSSIDYSRVKGIIIPEVWLKGM